MLEPMSVPAACPKDVSPYLACLSQKRIDRKRNLTHGSRQKELVVLELLKQPGSGEIDADGAADHVESRHGFEG
jgi:hypothetical protein